MSVFSLKERKVSPGGFFECPVFREAISALGQKKSRPKKEKGGNWGIGGPSFVKPNPQGGILMFPLFGPGFKHVSEKGKPAKSPKTKPIRKKGSSAHKTLHSPSHPILAEAQRLGIYQCDSSSMTPLVTVSGQRKQKESNLNIVAANFKESSGSGGTPNKFRVVLIEEGMGNHNDCFYYTREALESAVPLFTGLKIMADHPTAEEEEIRPERSTKDILGHYENLAVETAEDGQSQLVADVDIIDSKDTEWARARMIRAIENSKKFPDRPFIGLSINASGPSDERPISDVIELAPDGAKQKLVDAQADGIETLRVVQKINRAVSCDLVTEAGAGGKILNVIGGKTDGQKTA